MPIITLEVMLESSSPDDSGHMNEQQAPNNVEAAIDDPVTGVHFLTDKPDDAAPNTDKDTEESPKRNDLLEYMMRNDGSVICKLCGEVLQSRTHWYRHKYKLHVMQPLNPSPLFQCEQCLVYFKSRKGYIGHLASRHSEILSDSSPVLTNSQAEAPTAEKPPPQSPEDTQEEPDPELSIPKSSVPNYQTTTVKQTSTKTPETRRPSRETNKADWEEKRSREEKLVADIIDRVRRECEAQGSGGAGRRGYTRRTTVMHT